MPPDNSLIEQNYQHAVVRDLAWAVASPPLIITEQSSCRWFDADWYRQRYQHSLDWLHQLDQDPAALLAVVEAQKDRRLGNYFETLWAFWLEHDPRYELITRNLAIRDGGNTLGELDFLIHDRETGFNFHWEVAVKFYLGLGDTRETASWHGPGKRDRLDLKLVHLRDRQSQICQLPQTQAVLREIGVEVAGCAVLLKGRLFYPAAEALPDAPEGACPQHLRSHWYRQSDWFENCQAGDQFAPLLNSGWMSEHAQPDAKILSASQLQQALAQGVYRLPLYLLHYRQSGCERLFLVPDDWADSLRAFASD